MSDKTRGSDSVALGPGRVGVTVEDKHVIDSVDITQGSFKKTGTGAIYTLEVRVTNKMEIRIETGKSAGE